MRYPLAGLVIGLSSLVSPITAFGCTDYRVSAERLSAYLRILDASPATEPTLAELGFPDWAIVPEYDAVEQAGQTLTQDLSWLPLLVPPLEQPMNGLSPPSVPPVGGMVLEELAVRGAVVVFQCSGRVLIERS